MNITGWGLDLYSKHIKTVLVDERQILRVLIHYHLSHGTQHQLLASKEDATISYFCPRFPKLSVGRKINFSPKT